MRVLSSLLLGTLLSAGAIAAPATGPIPPAPYKEGVNYQPVVPAQPLSVNPGQIEVVDFFWYGCPHCNALEPYLEAWERSKAANVVLVRVPAVLEPDWEPAAHAYYVAKELGIVDQAQPAIFDGMHKSKVLPQNAVESDFENFFAQQWSVDRKKFESTWNSPVVAADLAHANELVQRYGILSQGVPTLIVDGKWMTGGGFGVTYSQIMQVVDFLVQKEQAALPAAAK